MANILHTFEANNKYVSWSTSEICQKYVTGFCENRCSEKFLGHRPATLFDRDSNTGVFL